MANHRSAAKRARQALVRRARNRSTLSSVHTAQRKLDSAIQEGSKEAAQGALAAATALIQRAASKGVLHDNTASRKVARLTRRVNALA